jgi:hypothetical protein
MATRAELRARLSLDKSVFDRGIAAAQIGATRLAGGLTSAARIGTHGFVALGAAAVGLGAAITVGIKKAFDLGGNLADMSAISGRSARDILLLRRALEDAGVSMEKIDRFILTGQDRGHVIARALKNITAEGGWADAARSVGAQADILGRNASVFDRVNDLLGRSGDKMQGFFVGVADRVSASLLPLLERFDRTDFAGMGQKFGDALVNGANVLTGLFNNPQLLFGTASTYFRAAVLGMGDVLIAVFKAGINFFQDGMFQALGAIGSAVIATLVEAFQKPIAYLQAGIQHAMAIASGGPGAVGSQIAMMSRMRDSIGRNMSGGLNPLGRSYQNKINELEKQRGSEPTFQQRYQSILSSGVKFGLGEGMTADEWRAQANGLANEGITKAARVALNFKVPDVLGAGAALNQNNGNLGAAATRGAAVLGNRVSPFDFISGGYMWPKGSTLPGGIVPPGYNEYKTPGNRQGIDITPLKDEQVKTNDHLRDLVEALTDD